MLLTQQQLEDMFGVEVLEDTACLQAILDIKKYLINPEKYSLSKGLARELLDHKTKYKYLQLQCVERVLDQISKQALSMCFLGIDGRKQAQLFELLSQIVPFLYRLCSKARYCPNRQPSIVDGSSMYQILGQFAQIQKSLLIMQLRGLREPNDCRFPAYIYRHGLLHTKLQAIEKIILLKKIAQINRFVSDIRYSTDDVALDEAVAAAGQEVSRGLCLTPISS